MISVEANNRFIVGARAFIVGAQNCEQAWAEKYVRRDPDVGWVLGNFVEADNANDNGHIFPLQDLSTNYQSILNKPLNMLHHSNYVVGSYVAADLVTPEKATADGTDASGNPYVEALAGFWKRIFPEEYRLLEKAHADGNLYFSMEAVPESLNCVADGCQFKETAVDYAGPKSDTYCAHMNEPRAQRVLNNPHFIGGAMIVPPVRPGWRRADVSELSQLLQERQDEVEQVYAALEQDMPHLGPKEWEQMMLMIMEQARDVSTNERKKLAQDGNALPDGSFPIANLKDLDNAIKAWGRVKDGKKSQVKSHLLKRATALNAPPFTTVRIKQLS